MGLDIIALEAAGEAPNRADLDKARRRATMLLIALFWVFAFAVISLRAIVLDPRPFIAMAPRRLMAAAFGTLLCLAIVYVLARLRARAFHERIVWGIVGAFVATGLLTGFNLVLNRALMPVPGSPPISLAEFVQWWTIWLGYVLAWTGTHLALTHQWELEDQQRHSSALKDLAQEARIAALRYQLNPHFLFNTLNSISSLVLEQRNAEAETMLLNLSAFLRATLGEYVGGTITVHEEIALQRMYLTIEEVRFPDRMRFTVALPPDLAQLRVPPLILQPLVENAIRHAVEPSEGLITIAVAVNQQPDGLRLVVEDDNPGSSSVRRGTGVGLNNVRERLQAHFGSRGTLVASKNSRCGYRAEIHIPLECAT